VHQADTADLREISGDRRARDKGDARRWGSSGGPLTLIESVTSSSSCQARPPLVETCSRMVKSCSTQSAHHKPRVPQTRSDGRWAGRRGTYHSEAHGYHVESCVKQPARGTLGEIPW
jgi:hypothetical protein